MDIKKQVEYFKGLPYETRKNKILEILKQLQPTHETFSLFYKTISKLTIVSEQILVYIYQGIFEIAAEIELGNKDKAEDKIKHMAEILMTIRKQEEMEREREGNPDEMLKSL